MFLLLTLIGLLAGILIGTIGIGGVILVPLLSFVLGIDLHIAMSASSLSFLFPGIVGTLTYANKRSIVWEKVLWLSVGIIPAALLGALVNTNLNTDVLVLIVAGLIAFSGINVFINRQNESGVIPDFRKPLLIIIGALVGFGSSLTGDGRAGSFGANTDNTALPGVKINRHQSGYSTADCGLCSDWFLALWSDRSGIGVALGNRPSGRCIYWRTHCASFANCSADTLGGHSINRSWRDDDLADCCLVPEKSNSAKLDKSIRAQAFWQNMKSQIAKAKWASSLLG